MELPFAVEASDGVDNNNTSLEQSESSSLVTASSQGSFINTSPLPLPPNTPHDVVLPAAVQFRLQQQQQQQHTKGQLVVTSASPPDPTNSNKNNNAPEADFTYVNVSDADVADEDDDEVDILWMDDAPGNNNDYDVLLDPLQQHQHPRGDVLTALLSGIQPSENDAIMVSVACLPLNVFVWRMQCHSRIRFSLTTYGCVFSLILLLTESNRSRQRCCTQGVRSQETG